MSPMGINMMGMDPYMMSAAAYNNPYFNGMLGSPFSGFGGNPYANLGMLNNGNTFGAFGNSKFGSSPLARMSNSMKRFSPGNPLSPNADLGCLTRQGCFNKWEHKKE